MFLCMLLLLVLRESTGGVLIIQQLFNSVKLGKRDPKMAAAATAAACNLLRSGSVENRAKNMAKLQRYLKCFQYSYFEVLIAKLQLNKYFHQ